MEASSGSQSCSLSAECQQAPGCCSGTPNQRDARPLQDSAFKTNLFEDECQAGRDYVPFLDPLVLPEAS